MNITLLSFTCGKANKLKKKNHTPFCLPNFKNKTNNKKNATPSSDVVPFISKADVLPSLERLRTVAWFRPYSRLLSLSNSRNGKNSARESCFQGERKMALKMRQSLWVLSLVFVCLLGFLMSSTEVSSSQELPGKDNNHVCRNLIPIDLYRWRANCNSFALRTRDS